MAKLNMKKIEIIAPLTDSKKIIELLQRRGVVEINSCDDEELVHTNVAAVIGEFEKFRSCVSAALDLLNKYAPEKSGLNSLFGGRTELDKHEFAKGAMKFEDIINKSNEILRNNKIITDSKTESAQLVIKTDILKPWINLDVPLNFHGTHQTTAFIGSVPYAISAKDLELLLPEYCMAEVISSSKEQTNLFILCSRSYAQEAEQTLRTNAFMPISENEKYTPAELIDIYNSRIKELNKNVKEAEKKIASFAEIRKQLKFTVDYLEMRKDKYKALNDLGFTESTFVLTGYIPEKYTKSLQNEIEKKYTAAISFSEPTEDDDVPVLLENSSFSSPLEGITRMYAMPSAKDVDPTPVMSFFYYLFFGLMLSDAGYGLVIVIGTVIALKKFTLEDSMRKTLTMFRNCGISTIIWGALFGSWFGDIVQVVAREFFGKEIGSIALWFQPLDDPIKLLLYCFALGIIHLFLGVAVSFRMTWKEGRRLDAVFDSVPVYMIILGAAPLAAGILVSVPKILGTIGTYVLIIGVVFLLLTAGRTSKSIFGKFFGGLYALYNTATGYLGDILSYSRLLALGLATGSIASVINLIGTMPENKVFKLILLVVVFIVGHIANLAINLLGAYVHTDRLQFVELFSKFYTGGGRDFDPLTIKTKYIKFKEEKTNE